MTQELRPFQIQLFRILLSLAALGTVFGVARRFDGFAAIITLFGLMIATLLFRRRWCDLASADGGILLGGGLMTLSSFFVLCYGPMGGAVRHAALLQNVTFTLGGMAWTLLLWPEMFGLTSMCLAFGVILAGRENVGFEPLRWRLLYLLLFAVSFVQVLLVFTHWPQISETPEFYIVVWQAGISVISLGLYLTREAVSHFRRFESSA